MLAAYSLVMDFESIKAGVERGAPRVFGLQAAFGIVVTVVWLYVEILRISQFFAGSNTPLGFGTAIRDSREAGLDFDPPQLRLDVTETL